MPDHPVGPAMSQKIFSMNLAVETVSVYLLCCAVTDAGAPITVEAVADKWNGEIAGLEAELERLENKNIIRRTNRGDQSSTVFQLVDDEHWV
jgi:hypothetical protein